MQTICPKCGGLAIVQSTLSPEYIKVKCFNTIEVKMKGGKTKSENCGFDQFVKLPQKAQVPA